MNNNDGKIIDVKPARSAGKIIAAVIIILALVIVILNSFTAVTAGHSGVVTTFGRFRTAF